MLHTLARQLIALRAVPLQLRLRLRLRLWLRLWLRLRLCLRLCMCLQSCLQLRLARRRDSSVWLLLPKDGGNAGASGAGSEEGGGQRRLRRGRKSPSCRKQQPQNGTGPSASTASAAKSHLDPLDPRLTRAARRHADIARNFASSRARLPSGPPAA